MSDLIELGLDTFGDVTLGADGALKPQDQVLRDVVEEAVLADQVGVDFIGLGEHHRDDFAISAPEIVLAAIAARTTRIRLGTAVTVLSSDDPVRVVERFATLDAISERPRRGDRRPRLVHRELPAVRLRPRRLRGAVRGEARPPRRAPEGRRRSAGPARPARRSRTSGSGRRSGRDGPEVWVGVGGSPESIVRAVRHDLPVMLAIIGGDPARFRPYVDLYQRACAAARPPGAADGRAFARPRRRDRRAGPRGALAGLQGDARPDRPRARLAADHPRPLRGRDRARRAHVGSPETVARKIARTIQALGAARFDLKYSSGTLAHDTLMRSIELYGTQVIPMVRELLGLTGPRPVGRLA